MKDYSLIVEGKRVSVSEQVYKEYYKYKERERYIEKVSSEKNLSFNALREQGYPIESKMVDKPLKVSDEVINRVVISKMLECIGKLNKYERMIIKEIYFNGVSERKLAKTLGKSRNTIQSQRYYILEKLKKLMKK